MKFKEFWNIPSSSDEPLLEISLEKKLGDKKNDQYEPLVNRTMEIDRVRNTIIGLEKSTALLDPQTDQDAILDLEYIIRNLREFADLYQEILVNTKITKNTVSVDDDILEGDEWKHNTEYEEKETHTHYQLKPHNQLASEAIESMNSRIQEIKQDVKKEIQLFKQHYPSHYVKIADYLPFVEPKENRTN